MSGAFTEDPRLAVDELVPLYRDVLAAHADDPDLGWCLICEQSRCESWRSAYSRLFRAGELRGEHERWRRLVEPDAPEKERS